MKRICLTFISYLAFIIIPVSVFAQEDDNDVSPSKRINDIKRSGEYVHAEETAETQKEAIEGAENRLLIELTNYLISQKGGDDAEKHLILRELPDIPDMITMPRGETLIRVFLYLKKSDIDLDKLEASLSVPVLKLVEIPEKTTDGATKPSKLEETPKVETPVVPKNEEKVVDKPKTEVKIVEEPAPKPAATKATNVELAYDDPALSEWQKRLIKDLVSKNTFLDAKIALNKYKAQNKIKRLGGPNDNCNSPSAAYYIISDSSGKIVAILSRVTQSSERIDYITGMPGFVEGNNYVWFVLSN